MQPLGAAPIIDDSTMEDLIEKLKLLNYETEFCPTSKPPFKLLTKTFFNESKDAGTNTNLQFFYFTSLVAWLMDAAGHQGFPAPGQFDDPNATSTNVIQELRAMQLPIGNMAPNRIRLGSGEYVLTILCLLVDRALMAKGFAFSPIQYPSEKAEDLDALDAARPEDAIDDDFIDDTIAIDSEDEPDEEYSSVPKGRGAFVEEEAIVPQVSSEQWALEVERVGPQLQLRSDDAGWRPRIEVVSTLMKAVEKMYPDVKTMLIRMGDDLEKSCDLIKTREQSLSQHFSEHVEEYRIKLRELSISQEEHNQMSAKVGALTNELNQLSEQIERTKSEMTERDNKFSDQTPLTRIKDALAKIRSEIKQMSLRIGVLQHTVLHYNLRQSKEKKSEPIDHEYSFNL